MSDDKKAKMTKRNHRIVCDIIMKMPKDAIYSGCFKQTKETAVISMQSIVCINIQRVHAILGHNNKETPNCMYDQ